MSTRDFTQDISHADLLQRIRYEPESGLFYWNCSIPRSQIQIGRLAGRKDKRHGYWHLGINRKHYLGHRLAWFYVHGRWPSHFIDHIDGDPSNNKLSNLREATDVQNQQNVNWRGYSEKRSRPYRNPFEANINVNGKNVYLGRFPTAEAARAAYLAANLKYFGDFSFQNRGSH